MSTVKYIVDSMLNAGLLVRSGRESDTAAARVRAVGLPLERDRGLGDSGAGL